MTIVITVLHVIACFFLIVVVLLQTGKGADIGAVFGGSSQTIFGSSGAGNLLTRLTTWTAALFMFTSLFLTWTSTRHLTASVVDSIPSEPPPISEPATLPGDGARAPSGESGGAAAPAEGATASGAAAADAGSPAAGSAATDSPATGSAPAGAAAPGGPVSGDPAKSDTAAVAAGTGAKDAPKPAPAGSSASGAAQGKGAEQAAPAHP